MTDDEYRAFLDVLFRRYVRPRLPRVRRRFHHHMEDEWRYHLNQAERAAQVLRYIENYCDDDGDVHRTFNVDRVTSAVDDTRSSLDFGNKTIEEAGFLDAYDLHADEILAGLRPEHLPEADKELLREMGSPDADAELTELVFRVRANRERVVQALREVSVRQQLHNIEERLAKAQQDFKIRVMGESDQAPTYRTVEEVTALVQGPGSDRPRCRSFDRKRGVSNRRDTFSGIFGNSDLGRSRFGRDRDRCCSKRRWRPSE